MGASSENFCLRWNDFESNVSGAFRELRAESDFFDVTLACSDSNGRNLQAHKVILSACSSFFKQMLRQMQSSPTHPNPYVYLRGVSHCDLSSVLDFMYHGEVNVAQDDLNSFLAVAEELQIKGLTNRDSSEATTTTPSNKAAATTKKSAGVRGRPPTVAGSNSGAPPVKRQRRSSQSSATLEPLVAADENDVKSVDIKSDPDPDAGPSGQQAVTTDDYEVDEDADFGDESYGDGYYDEAADGAELDASAAEGGDEAAAGGGKVSGMSIIYDRDSTKKWMCLECGYIAKRKDYVRLHITRKHSHGSKNLPCEFCGNAYKNIPSLKVHETRCKIRKNKMIDSMTGDPLEQQQQVVKLKRTDGDDGLITIEVQQSAAAVRKCDKLNVNK